MNTRSNKLTYSRNALVLHSAPNYSDLIALIIVLGVLVLLATAAKAMVGQYQVGQEICISLAPQHLPYYALHTVLRMFIAMGCALLFTFTMGTWAAKSKSAERFIIPLIDIMQSVPVLGFLSISVTAFIALFPGSMLGPECAAIFAIFTAQVWNITLSFYQNLKSVPHDLSEVAEMYHLSAWQKFWRIDVPYATPALLWNSMVSMSASWVFLTAAEAITIANRDITLPGIGSYIALAIDQADKQAVAYAIITMFLVIACYDQLIFRPLLVWIEKFRAETRPDESFPESWVYDLFQRSLWFAYLGRCFSKMGKALVNIKLFRRDLRAAKPEQGQSKISHWLKLLSNAFFMLLLLVSLVLLLYFISNAISFSELQHVVFLGSVTALRVFLMIIVSSLIWIPVGVWIGLNPRASKMVQPIVQFCAAFPVNLLFPLVVFVIIRYHLNVNIWTSPLMILGAQWYILFNVITGTAAIPERFHQVVNMLNVRSTLWWKRFILPAIFPYYVTGAITAAGGAWNISIISEYVSWGNVHLQATGLGAYIAEAANAGHFQKLAIAIMVMSLYVVVINRVIWRPLYNLAIERYQL